MYFSDIFSTLRQSIVGTLLLVIQVAFTFAVLVNIYAMIDAYAVQINGDAGYLDEESLIGVTLSPYAESPKTDVSRGEWRNRITDDLDLIRSVLGVKEVALALGGIPFQNSTQFNNFDKIRRVGEDETSGVPTTRYAADVNNIALLGLEIVSGRDFTAADVRWVDSIARQGGPSVIITETLAQALFPDEEAVGKQVVIRSGRTLNVIGIVRRAQGVYWAPFEEYTSFTAGRENFNHSYLLRLDRDQAGENFAAAKVRIMQSLSEKFEAVHLERTVKVETLTELKKQNLGRFIIINSIVGAVALLLILVTALGNYGQMSYTILKRTKQIGIRRALGATRTYILNYFLIESAMISVVGMLVGSLLMVFLNSIIINAMNYGKLEWTHIVSCVVFMMFVSLLSALLPIIRAMRISPAIATRSV